MPDRTKAIVTAIFDDADHASRAIDQLLRNGVDREAVSVVMADEVDPTGPDSDESKELVERKETRAERGAWFGALVGASGMALGATALAIPGIIALGPLAALLAGAGAGAVSGGALGALIGVGVSRDVAEVYHRSLEGGAVMVGAEVPVARRDEVEAVFEACGGRSPMGVEYE